SHHLLLVAPSLPLARRCRRRLRAPSRAGALTPATVASSARRSSLFKGTTFTRLVNVWANQYRFWIIVRSRRRAVEAGACLSSNVHRTPSDCLAGLWWLLFPSRYLSARFPLRNRPPRGSLQRLPGP
ncbi:hypothetical protein DFH06DRAFT_1484904, partial [Mycena polygramma]